MNQNGAVLPFPQGGAFGGFGALGTSATPEAAPPVTPQSAGQLPPGDGGHAALHQQHFAQQGHAPPAVQAPPQRFVPLQHPVAGQQMAQGPGLAVTLQHYAQQVPFYVWLGAGAAVTYWLMSRKKRSEDA